jgi:hypothetical protein
VEGLILHAGCVGMRDVGISGVESRGEAVNPSCCCAVGCMGY